MRWAGACPIHDSIPHAGCISNVSDLNDKTADRIVLADYQDALDRTNRLIDRSPPPAKTPSDVRARAEVRMARLRSLLRALGDPHLRYPVIHVAGTSGKGSTAVAAASILQAAGFRTGLHTSPYLQVATEKLRIDGALIDATTFLDVVDQVLAAAQNAGLLDLTYGEAWFALTALALAEARVQVAVIEVGAGGRFDLTNVVSPAVSVITSVGLDHMETLGTTIPEIAWHKAGIIKQGAPVVTAVADSQALAVIEQVAAETDTRIISVVEGKTFEATADGNGHYAWWELNRPEVRYPTAMPGRYQATNAATAHAAVRALPGMGASITPEAVRDGLRAARMQGRFEVVQRKPTVTLDGAHNPDKMAALVHDLCSWRSSHPESRLIAVIGMLESKDHQPMLIEIARVADEIVTTSPRVLAKPGADAGILAASAAQLGFAGRITAVDDPHSALDLAMGRSGSNDLVVVTGSLYLVGNVRGRWYPDDEIVLQRTPWPESRPIDI
jgi:dihydrofolate synthase/folylpolyglutamate synthase